MSHTATKNRLGTVDPVMEHNDMYLPDSSSLDYIRSTSYDIQPLGSINNYPTNAKLLRNFTLLSFSQLSIAIWGLYTHITMLLASPQVRF